MKILLIVLGVVAAIIVVFTLLLVWGSRKPVVQSNYYENVKTDKPLELKYTSKGAYNVSYNEYDAKNEKIGHFKIWYPSEMESNDDVYPLVVMANGTGVKSSRYEAIFEHLASWGFIVIGNEDENSWNGVSSFESLNLILDLNVDSSSLFYGKIDSQNIGIAGHSQGGVGVINAITNFDNSELFCSAYTASTPWVDLAVALEWGYEISKISIPYFMVAGTGKTDAETIIPLDAMKKAYDEISDQYLVVMARRCDTDHGEMLANADGYMTAWFCYTLKGDEEAGKVFVGKKPEIMDNNINWQDVYIKGTDE